MLELWDDNGIDCYLTPRRLYLYATHVPGKNITALLERPSLDHPGESHIWLLLYLEPSLRCYVGMRT